MKQILCVLIFAFNIYLSLLLPAQNLPYKSKSKKLSVTLNYWQQINDFLAYNEKLPNDCKIENTINKCIIICPAWVKILINKKQLLNWQQQQNKNGFINLYLPEIGILHEKAKIAKIKKIILQASTNKNQQLVISVYMRYAHVLKYKIKDINTGKVGEITATPEHKFYETTYKKFMAISKIGPHNTITNASNHHLIIICTNNRQNNCGTAPLNSLQKVYNIEVEKAHNYFVGNTKALVHNGCDYYFKCENCDETHDKVNLFSSECSKKAASKSHFLLKIYKCKFCSMAHKSEAYIDIHQIKFHETEADQTEGGHLLGQSLIDEKGKKILLLELHKAEEKFKALEREREQVIISSRQSITHPERTNALCKRCNENITLASKMDGIHRH